MTVRELISRLEQHDQDKIVVIDAYKEGLWEPFMTLDVNIAKVNSTIQAVCILRRQKIA